MQKIYEAFGKGDVATILDQVTEDVDWASEAEGTAPWHGVHKGKGEVPKFFEAIDANIEVTEFTPLTFTANDNDVLTVVDFGTASAPANKAPWICTTGSGSTRPARSSATAAARTPRLPASS